MSRPTMLLVTLFLVTLPFQIESANILALMGCASPSHHVWNSVLIDELASKGHNLTVISNDISKKPPPNVHYIHLDKTYEIMLQGEEDLNIIDVVQDDSITKYKFVYEYGLKLCDVIVEQDGFKTLLNYPNNFKFDAVLHDYTLGSCLLGFLHKFRYPPLIAVSAFKFTPLVTDLVGGHIHSAYLPSFYLPYNTEMSLWERVHNTFAYIVDHYYKEYYFMPQLQKIVSPFFDENLPLIRKLEQRTTIALLNTNPATDSPYSLPPNVIQVGGLQIKDPKPLPKDIDEFLSKSKKGSIFISFGTNVKRDTFPIDRQQVILDVVRKLPNYNFLWKFEYDPSEGKIPNLMVKPWLPQSDLLAHPNLKIFVTHSGGLSTQESTWRGVPMLAVPFFADQTLNAQRSVQDGVAEKLNVLTMTSEEFVHKLNLLLKNPSYRENMNIISRRFKDTPMKPLDTAVWWVEYILRDPNPTHLKSPVIKLGFWKSNLYDIIFYAFVIFLVLVVLLHKIVRAIYRMVAGSPKTNRKKKNN